VDEKDGSGILLLCEVFTGTPHVLAKAQYIEGKPPVPAHSTLGAGRTVPDTSGDSPLKGIAESLEQAVAAVADSGYKAPSASEIMGPQGCLVSAQVSYGPLRGINAKPAKGPNAPPAGGEGDSDDSDAEEMTLEVAQAKAQARAAAVEGGASAAGGGGGDEDGGRSAVLDSKGVDIEADGDLLYNEYIVYSEDQVRVRFACMVDFRFHGGVGEEQAEQI
jgi:hypothetical protein